MFGLSKIRAQLDELAKKLKVRDGMFWELEALKREARDLRSWNEKVRAKNSALRRDRRRLRELLETNDIPWERETPGG